MYLDCKTIIIININVSLSEDILLIISPPGEYLEFFSTLPQQNKEIKGNIDQPSSINCSFQPDSKVTKKASLFAGHSQIMK